METQNIKQRSSTKDEPTADAGDISGKDDAGGGKERRQKRMAMAKRGLKSLGIAVSIPLILTLTNTYLFGTNEAYNMTTRPNWVPPIWALHMACLGSAFLMGLCSWIVWAEGGFHRIPRALPLYLGQFGLSLLWAPLVFHVGAYWAGLLVAFGVCLALFQSYKVSRSVNQLAGDLVLPCLAWATLLVFVNLQLLLI